jgi:formamidopyrimidine-DNA glycosylase
VPEYPDVTVYIERLEAMLRGRALEGIRVASPFVLRTVDPPLSELHGRLVSGFERLGKRIIWCFEGELFLVIHLMIAGRLHWRKRQAALSGRNALAAFDFETSTLIFSETSKKKRASMHLVRGRDALSDFDRGGLELIGSSASAFAEAMRSENHTLKRALTDPRILSGVGNAYSDEILHRARMSPFRQTRSMSADELAALHEAAVDVLEEWTARLREEAGDGFPERVTAFRPEMAVHGKYREPCPVCGKEVQRIRYADNEANYCAQCQTGGRLLADRSLSRLLKQNWPRTLEELEERRPPRKSSGRG